MSGDSTDPPPPVLDPRRALSFYRVERGLSQTGLAAKLGGITAVCCAVGEW